MLKRRFADEQAEVDTRAEQRVDALNERRGSGNLLLAAAMTLQQVVKPLPAHL